MLCEKIVGMEWRIIASRKLHSAVCERNKLSTEDKAESAEGAIEVAPKVRQK